MCGLEFENSGRRPIRTKRTGYGRPVKFRPREVMTKVELRHKLLVGEASRILELSPQRVRELVDRGTLPAERGAMGIRLLDRTAVVDLARRRKARRPVVTR